MMRPIRESTSGRCFSLVLFVAMLLALGGCASTGPTYTEFKPTAPRLDPGSGRIYLYRASVLGAAVQPAIKVNNDVVGAAQPLGFFYVDRKPGAYEISTTTEVERKLSLTLDAGQTRYVRLNISIGFFVGHVYPELVDNDVGEKEMQECHYTGSTGGKTP